MAMDDLLSPYLQVATAEESEQILAHLIGQQLSPIVKEIVTYKLRFSGGARLADEQQREDVCQDALMRLLQQIRQCRLPSEGLVIEDLRGLTAVIARRSCYDYLRRKYPRRHSLKTRLHYLLTHQPGFSLWNSPRGEAIAGYDAWSGQNPTGRAAGKLAQLMKNASGHLPAETLTQECAQRRPADLVAAICDYTGGPVAFDDLVTTIAILWNVKEDAVAEDELAHQSDTAAGTLRQLEGREFLQELWTEMLQLPVRQRHALLLNLRDADGGGCIALLPLTGVATLRQIAVALEMPAEQLAALWGRLPLDDLELAAYLSLTRQQVINLRKAARARLARRLKDFF